MVTRSSRDTGTGVPGKQRHPYRAVVVALIGLVITLGGAVAPPSAGGLGMLGALLGLMGVAGSYGVWIGDSWGYTVAGIALVGILFVSFVGGFGGALSGLALLGILVLPHDLHPFN